MRACESSDEENPDIGSAAFALRKATTDDLPQLIRLHRVAMRELGRSAYTVDQIDAFLLNVPTLDAALIDDGTYYVAEAQRAIVGAGGWSFRAPAYGDAIDLCPAPASHEPAAVIRAMYTHPDWARRGIGRAILEAAEAEARAAGFRRIELHALLPGVPLYRACGLRHDRAAPGTASTTASRCRSSICASMSTPAPRACRAAAAPGIAPPDFLESPGLRRRHCGRV